MSNDSSQNSDQVSAPSPRRKRLVLLALLILICAGAYLFWWWTDGQFYEQTDDAYVTGDHIALEPEISGTVVQVNVDNTQHVKAGQILVKLDPADANLALSKAEAKLASTVRNVHSLFMQSQGLIAQINASRIELNQAKADLLRRQQVAAEGGVSSENLQHAKDQVARLKATLTSTRKNLASIKVRIDHTTVQTHPDVLAAAEAVRQAALELARTTLRAPTSGTVVNRSVQVGQHVSPSQKLMTIVPLSHVWVNANFKEVQLAKVRVGQPVSLISDLYGSSVTYHGHVAGFSAGTGNAFALLPTQNASGNWIKIVQRLPIRIALDPNELKQHPLRVGLSMTAKIDLHDQSGSLVASKVLIGPSTKPAYQISPDITKRIAQIIAQNIQGGEKAP